MYNLQRSITAMSSIVHKLRSTVQEGITFCIFLEFPNSKSILQSRHQSMIVMVTMIGMGMLYFRF